jgi:predicted ATPase
MESAILAAGAGELDSSDVIRHLANLVTKSLIVANVSGPSPRYKLLGTVRAFAAEKLKQSGEFDAVTYRNTRLSADLPKRTKHLLDSQLNECSP